MNLKKSRFNMVEQQVRPWRVFNEQILEPMATIDRENFVLPQHQNIAYSDVELPLPNGTKMLFPRIVARLLQELNPNKKDKILEIGTGSGYVTAILAKLSDFVYSTEICPENKAFAVQNLMKAGVKNVSISETNGLNGYEAKAPFDKIFIGGAVVKIEENLKNQLKINGKLVAVVGNSPVMHAILIERISDTEFTEQKLFETNLEYLTSQK